MNNSFKEYDCPWNIRIQEKDGYYLSCWIKFKELKEVTIAVDGYYTVTLSCRNTNDVWAKYEEKLYEKK